MAGGPAERLTSARDLLMIRDDLLPGIRPAGASRPEPDDGAHAMSDVVLIATIVVFFVAAAALVGVLNRVIADSGDDAGPEDEELPWTGLEPRRPA